jgi:hypothetical protein
MASESSHELNDSRKIVSKCSHELNDPPQIVSESSHELNDPPQIVSESSHELNDPPQIVSESSQSSWEDSLTIYGGHYTISLYCICMFRSYLVDSLDILEQAVFVPGYNYIQTGERPSPF